MDNFGWPKAFVIVGIGICAVIWQWLLLHYS